MKVTEIRSSATIRRSYRVADAPVTDTANHEKFNPNLLVLEFHKSGMEDWDLLSLRVYGFDVEKVDGVGDPASRMIIYPKDLKYVPVWVRDAVALVRPRSA